MIQISYVNIQKNKLIYKTVDVYRDYKSKKEEIAEIDEMLNETEDKEEIEMLKEESASLKSAIPELEEQLKFLLIPKRP